MKKKILFLTGTRADFGKLKSLIRKTYESDCFEIFIFVTGMHMISKYGMTATEVEKCKFGQIYKFINQNMYDSMDIILSKTIHGLSDYVKEISPDMIVVHGDRVEAMAGAIVGALNNILVSHIEGGEVSGTIDEVIRHSISKMSHIHFVSNSRAKERLIQLGELEDSIFEIGSPDLDIMSSNELPTKEEAQCRYNIPYERYAIFMYHPVTTELELLENNIKEVVDAIIQSERKYIVIYPNNDNGTEIILKEFDRISNHPNFRVFPSIRFEYFITLLKNSDFIIGNSSAGVREMPFYGKPSINIGSRQNGRSKARSIINVPDNAFDITNAIESISSVNITPTEEFGDGNSDKLFLKCLLSDRIWGTSKQKVFVDI
ncbi:UDP-N-acetylglucosamine 2-epimerase [Shewanella algae]|uniref:UDP-N-acetylglucosamine 2-epimerase n=1 Tax=Shewanella algae TaxID=38313 RepID=UPI001AAF558A|nr:UDP-N-acetylglucosamine 2-epimerase [Shewanella algae]MBO2590365.1 UDP-N-acetylglucosamine 2-epimerase (hydrolyzing) [Shewanella algae]